MQQINPRGSIFYLKRKEQPANDITNPGRWKQMTPEFLKIQFIGFMQHPDYTKQDYPTPCYQVLGIDDQYHIDGYVIRTPHTLRDYEVINRYYEEIVSKSRVLKRIQNNNPKIGIGDNSMGMFDSLKNSYKLPNEIPASIKDWQTKDLECFLDNYEITQEGRLMHETYHIEDRSDPNASGIMRLAGCLSKIHEGWEDINYHGILEFHTIEDNVYYSCEAKFTDGQCVGITVNEITKLER